MWKRVESPPDHDGSRRQVGVNVEKMKEAHASRWAFIYGFDIEKHKGRCPRIATIQSAYVAQTHHVDAGQFLAKCEETCHL